MYKPCTIHGSIEEQAVPHGLAETVNVVNVKVAWFGKPEWT